MTVKEMKLTCVEEDALLNEFEQMLHRLRNRGMTSVRDSDDVVK